MKSAVATKRASGGHQRITFWLFYVCVVAAGILALALAPVPPGTVSSLTFWLWIALLILAGIAPIPLPAGGSMTVSSAMNYAGIVVMGPIPTAWAGVISAMFLQLVILRKPVVKSIFNAAVLALTVLVAGWVYLALGGTVGKLHLPGDMLYLLISGIAYFVVNTGSISLVIGLEQRLNTFRVWQVNFMWTILHLLALLPFGALLALVYLSAGMWAILLFFVPLLLARYSFKLYVDMRRDHFDFVKALTGVIDEIDPYTRQHSLRVAEYSVRLARGLGLRESDVRTIEYAALVHDLGKVDLRYRDILGKPGALSTDERKTLRRHPGIGADIVTKVKSLKRASEMVRSHHERPDGKGYPYGLVDQDVPLGARILNVADAFDAMTSDRPYRPALTLEQAVAEVKRCCDTQFDKRVAGCLVRMYEAGQFDVYREGREETHSMRAAG
ncbi:MAG: HD domain-containing protein [Candidatus Eisenbacteria bacterium]|nr:HD domain-containing protein [Candidatus Eisenbacteria bacterium]